MSSHTNVHDLKIEVILLGKKRVHQFSQIPILFVSLQANVKTAKISKSTFCTLYLCRSSKLLTFICKTQFSVHV